MDNKGNHNRTFSSFRALGEEMQKNNPAWQKQPQHQNGGK